MRMKESWQVAVVAICLVGCQQREAIEPANQTEVGNMRPAVTSPPGTGMGAGEAGAPSSISYDLPEAWERQPPRSSMRLDQAVVPGEAGAGELAVFFFGPGGGGGVDENLERWAGQITGGAPPTRETFESGAFRVHWMDASGTLQPSMMGGGPTEPMPNSRMLAAVVEGPGGPWFFKLTGPEATIAQERDNFMQLLRSIRAAS